MIRLYISLTSNFKKRVHGSIKKRVKRCAQYSNNQKIQPKIKKQRRENASTILSIQNKTEYSVMNILLCVILGKTEHSVVCHFTKEKKILFPPGILKQQTNKQQQTTTPTHLSSRSQRLLLLLLLRPWEELQQARRHEVGLLCRAIVALRVLAEADEDGVDRELQCEKFSTKRK